MTLIYFALNSGLIATAVGLESRQSPMDIWRRHFQWLGIGYMASASLAFCFILLIQQVSFLAAIVILPLLVVFHLTLKAGRNATSFAPRQCSLPRELTPELAELIGLYVGDGSNHRDGIRSRGTPHVRPRVVPAPSGRAARFRASVRGSRASSRRALTRP